jgi:LPS sulfotransferase NodH
MLKLMRQHGFRFIHLRRMNLLKIYVSALVSAKTRVWATAHPEEVPDRTVHVPIDTLRDTLSRLYQDRHHHTMVLRGDDTVHIPYENLFQNGVANVDDMELIAAHIGVEPKFDLVPKYKKIGLPLSEAIQNYNEVVGLLKGTNFGHYLR